MGAWEAACAGVFVHGRTAHLAGAGMVVEDLLGWLGVGLASAAWAGANSNFSIEGNTAHFTAGGELLDHRQRELGRACAVDHAVVECRRDVADLADDDLSATHDRAGCDPVDPEDRNLRVIDERRDDHAAELPCGGDREGSSA